MSRFEAMSEQDEFERLLRHAGAVSPRDGRGKWKCPDCGRWCLIVSLEHLNYRCQFRSGRSDQCRFFGGITKLRTFALE